MKFDVERLKSIARPMTKSEQQEMDERNENRDWMAMSAKFALLVRHILRTTKMTQTELATRMGVSSVRITKILSGKENLCLQTIAKIEKAIGQSLLTFSESTDPTDIPESQSSFTQIFSFMTYSATSDSFERYKPAGQVFSQLSPENILV